jgi:hypothetical protein
MGGDTLEYFRRQSGEKMVLCGGHNSDHFLSLKREIDRLKVKKAAEQRKLKLSGTC